MAAIERMSYKAYSSSSKHIDYSTPNMIQWKEKIDIRNENEAGEYSCPTSKCMPRHTDQILGVLKSQHKEGQWSLTYTVFSPTGTLRSQES